MQMGEGRGVVVGVGGVPSYAPSGAEVLDDDDATNNGKRDSIEKIKCLPRSGEKEELEHHVGGEGRGTFPFFYCCLFVLQNS